MSQLVSWNVIRIVKKAICFMESSLLSLRRKSMGARGRRCPQVSSTRPTGGCKKFHAPIPGKSRLPENVSCTHAHEADRRRALPNRRQWSAACRAIRRDDRAPAPGAQA